MTGAYSRYLTAAKRKHVGDPGSIIEAAEADLTPRQLAQLASVLADRHGYRLPKARRDPLIDALLAEDLPATRIADLLGCSTRTVARRRAAQVGSTNGLNKRCGPDKTGPRELHPILSFSARGGGDDVRIIRRVLRGDPA